MGLKPLQGYSPLNPGLKAGAIHGALKTDIRHKLILKFKKEPTPQSPINWILSGVEGCKHLIISTLRLRSVSGFPLNCLFGADSKKKPSEFIKWAGSLDELPRASARG